MSRSRLYTRFRSQRTHQREKLNIVILDIDENDFLINNPNIQMKIFTKDEIDACIDYITSEITNLYLFISSGMSNTYIPLIYNCEQIKSINILEKNEKYENYSYAKEKVQNIFSDIDTMFKQFQDDITKLDNEIYSEKSTFESINPESAQILWWKFFDKILQNIKHTNIAKDEFIDFSKENFPDDERALKEIEELESDYTSNEAIYWYTQEIFLYRFVNQTLRNQKNFNNIFKLRLFLTDLLSGLKTAQLDSDNINHNSLIVYRGQQMTIKEIERMKSNVGNSIFFHQFLSTSLNREFARSFVEHSSRYGVLFTIKIDSDDTTSGMNLFANISKYSTFQDEEELLFSMHSTFLIESVELNENNLWNIHLKFKDNLWDTDFDQRSIFSPHADQIFIRNLSKENKQFIAFQLLLDILLRLEPTQYAKDELIQFSRSKYQDDPIELRKINEFNNEYHSDDAMKWFTKDCFLYRLLNQSLRSEIIDCIVKMRYFIHDLHNQLAQLQPSSIQSLNGQTNFILYRGQTMKINQLNEIRENINGFISMNSFLSATQDKQVAIVFSGDGRTTNSDEISVIYEMLINTNIRSTPYAKIESVMTDEKEILFSMGSIFRIGEIDKFPDHDKVYRVKLTMEHIECDLWNKLTAHLD
jgi:hypothetical protein